MEITYLYEQIHILEWTVFIILGILVFELFFRPRIIFTKEQYYKSVDNDKLSTKINCTLWINSPNDFSDSKDYSKVERIGWKIF